MIAAGCTRCATPLEDGDLRCAVCALPVPEAAAPVAHARVQILRCTECGAAIGFDANRGAPACRFCGAVMVIEEPADPVEVAAVRLPFAVDRDAATRALHAWLGARGFFAPKSLRDEAVIDALQPVGWAAWLVNARAQVAWTADSDSGAGRSAWAPHAGMISIDVGDLVVPASRGLAHAECARLVPHYDLATALPVAGDAAADDVPAEGFDVQRSAARRHVHAAIEAVARTRVEPAIPGHRYRNVHVSCLLERQTTERVALPAWVMAYRYRGSPYRAIVHGQRADVVLGASPVDWLRVLWVALGALAIVAAVVAVAMLARYLASAIAADLL